MKWFKSIIEKVLDFLKFEKEKQLDISTSDESTKDSVIKEENTEEIKVKKELSLPEKLELYGRYKGYSVFTDNSKQYNVNIWFIRSNDDTPDSFNDTCVVFWKNKNKWEYKEFNCTTDPGVYWMTKVNYKAVAILAEGQYKGCYKIDTHRAGSRSAHKALCQRLGKVKVYRDGNKDKVHDFDVKTEEGWFGINCHRPTLFSERTGIIGASSAGCMVISSRREFDNETNSYDKNTFMGLLELSRKNWGNKFSITLCSEKELNNFLLTL